MYVLAVAEGDRAEMQRHFDASMGKPGIEDILLTTRSDTEAYGGHLRGAREFSERALFNRPVKTMPRRRLRYGRPMRLCTMRSSAFPGEAWQQAQAALSLAPGRDVRVLAGMSLARAGYTTEANRLADGLNREFPLDTLVQHYVLPTIRAVLAINREDGQRALKLLEATAEYEYGCPPHS
jgi:eukaryotic-like serine/threonine-protein kinase